MFPVTAPMRYESLNVFADRDNEDDWVSLYFFTPLQSDVVQSEETIHWTTEGVSHYDAGVHNTIYERSRKNRYRESQKTTVRQH
jgi:hypothetical protein